MSRRAAWALVATGALAVAIVIWAPSESSSRQETEGDSSVARRNDRSLGTTAEAQRCDHPLLRVGPGEEWAYRVTIGDVVQEIVLLAEHIERRDTGYDVHWTATVAQGVERHRRPLTTRCEPEGSVELPLEAFVSRVSDAFESVVCAFPADLDDGLEVRDNARTELGEAERTCTVKRSAVPVSVPAGEFEATEIELSERGTIGDREVVSQSALWIAPAVGVVRWDLESGTALLLRHPTSMSPADVVVRPRSDRAGHSKTAPSERQGE